MTSSDQPLLAANLPSLQLLARGKVRDVFEVDKDTLLFVATDRLSAFDVVMKNGVPGKGCTLTKVSEFWFKYLATVSNVPNHLITCDVDEMPDSVRVHQEIVRGRSMLVKKLRILPVEAIVRGYITGISTSYLYASKGSSWKEYTKTGTVCGMPIRKGLLECEKLDVPIFTPSTKAEDGGHDENIHPNKLREIVGPHMAEEIERAALDLYTKASEFALTKGIIIADTKFEFGVDENGILTLADEVLTPGSTFPLFLLAFQTRPDSGQLKDMLQEDPKAALTSNTFETGYRNMTGLMAQLG